MMTNSNRFIANDEVTGTLLSDLQTALATLKPNRARIATAYLTPDGFLAIKDGLQSVASVRLLLGERPFLTRRGPLETLAGGTNEELEGPSEAIDWLDFLEGRIPWILMNHDQRKALLSEEGEEAFEQRKAFDLGAWQKVQELVHFLEREGVGLRRFLGEKAGRVPQGRVLDPTTASNVHLHAKCYLFAGGEGNYSVIGSSNLTKGGLENNVEANLVSNEAYVCDKLEQWFERKWLQGQDCKEEFVRRLEECVLYGRRFTPWQVFIKALHTAYGRFLGLGLSEEIAGRLATFQTEGVARAVELLERHWGAMICDSVGLGKTFTGLGILKEYLGRKKSIGKALVICPAQLEHNWDVDRLRQWGIPGETITMESLPQLVGLEEIEDSVERRRFQSRLKRLQGYDVVLVDESHNFRNPGTKRYQALMEIIRGGLKPDKRVVLLTATPINNTLWDLYHQLMLITRGDNSWYVGRGPVGNLEGTFRNLEKSGGGPGLLDTMLLTLVRRTRYDIRQRQDRGEPIEIAGKPVFFPKHDIPGAITYSLEAIYEGKEIYKEIIATFESLTFAVYNLEKYGVEAKTEDEKKQQESAVHRNESFIGILRTNYLKRMESSVEALRTSLRRQVAYLDLFLDFLKKGKVISPKDRDRLQVILGGALEDENLEGIKTDERWQTWLKGLPTIAAGSLKGKDLEKDVHSDLDSIKRLLELVENTRAKTRSQGDPKIQALRKLISSFPATDARGIPTKVVIFTYFKDTAYHIFEMLGGPAEANWGTELRAKSNLPGEPWMSLLTGDDDGKRRLNVLAHFAPLSFYRTDEDVDDPALLEKINPLRKESIEVLVATDVMSEGQNLQDAQYLINYDLHWNPVRMIQRAGRIDRLFSPHEHVFFYNIMPEQGLEELLRLVSRLQLRAKAIDATIGLDASVLGEIIQEKAIDQLLAIKQGGDKADQIYLEGEKRQDLDDALEQLRQYVELVRQLGTEEVQEIPNGVYSVKRGPNPGVFLLLKMPEEFGGEVFWRFYPANGNTALKAAVEVVERIASQRDDLRAELPPHLNPFEQLVDPLSKGVSELAQEYRRMQAAQEPSELVRLVRVRLQSDEVEEAIPDLAGKLSTWCTQPHPDDLLRREDRVQDAYRGLKVASRAEDIIKGLRDLWAALEAKGLDRPLPRPSSREPSERDLQLICWEWVIPEHPAA